MNFQNNDQKNNNGKTNRLHTDVISAQIIHINHVKTFSSTGYHTVLYPCDGSGELQISNPDEYYSAENLSFDTQKAFFIHDGSVYKIKPDSENVILLMICFELYICSDITKDSGGNIIIKASPYSFPVFLSLKVDDHNNMLINLLTQNTMKIASNIEQLSNVLEAFLECSALGHINNFEDVLSNVYAVAFHTVRPLEQSAEFYFKNAEIWSDNPEKNTDAVLLFEASVEHKFIEYPSNYEYRYILSQHEEICLFYVEKNQEFKIWFHPDNGKWIDLLPFWKTCHIRFAIKSNLNTQISLSLFNNSNKRYRAISFDFKTAKINEWQIFTLPISNYFYRQSGALYVDEAINYIRSHYAKKITSKDIAAHLHIHVSYLHYLFRKHFEQTVNQYIINYRIMKAKELLIKSRQTTESIAAAIGFYDQRHFSKTFQKIIGMTPTQYRKNNK